MASELRVNTINSRTGFGTITVSETGQDLVGITTIENLTAENTLVGAAASFTGNVQIGGVLTYEDVTNIDSVGLITARSGIEIGARPGVGASISADGNAIFSGITTFGGNITANGNIVGDNSTDISGINDVTISMLSISDTITHTGDTNTKIRFPSADTITAETGGSERVRIDSSGRLMVGNTAAASMFSVANNLVVGSGSGSEGMTIYSDSTNDGYIVFADGASDPAYRMGQIIYSHQLNKLQFRTNGNTDRLVIDSSGNTNIAGVCTATAFSPTSGQISNRNLLHNGAFNVAQRGTSSGSSGFKAIDRWRMNAYGASAALTQSQTAITSGDPFDAGFRNVFKILNAGQNANNQAYCYIMHSVEAQDLAQSGWDYTSTSSYITLSFWIKASVAQTYLLTLHAPDSSTLQEYNHLITCAANTWKKVTLTIPGKSTIAVNNDTGKGIEIILAAYLGDHYTSGSTVDQWVNHAGYTSRPDMGSTWWATSSSTIEITGMQLEVGPHATPFEHRTYADDLRICQRFFWKIGDNTYRRVNGYKRHDTNVHFEIQAPVPMRVAPSPTMSDGGLFTNFQGNLGSTQSSPAISEWDVESGKGLLVINSDYSSTHVTIPSWEGYTLELSAEQ